MSDTSPPVSLSDPNNPPAVGAAQSFIEGEFGGPTEENDYYVSVGTSVTKLVGNDPEALALTIINMGTSSVNVLFNDTVSLTKGIILAGGGGGVSLNVRDDQTLPTRAWYAIGSSGTNDVLVIRTRRYALTYQPVSTA